MDKHWHLFGISMALWTLTIALLIGASATGAMILAAWAIVLGLHAACTTCWVIARHERIKIEEFCTGSAAGIVQWIRHHEAEQECTPMR